MRDHAGISTGTADVGNRLISLQGYDPDDAASLPLRVALLAGGPATLVLAVPACAAVWFGRLAVRGGDRRGRVLAILGIVVVCLMLVPLIATIAGR